MTSDKCVTPVQTTSPAMQDDAREKRIAALVSRIRVGLIEEDTCSFMKLQIARRYGPFVKELKSLAPHGEFKKLLTQHFPKASYDKCNRWRYLAENEDRIAAALEEFPDVKWGPKKMTDYLKGIWSPKAEDEEDRFDGDEDEYLGIVTEAAPDISSAHEAAESEVATDSVHENANNVQTEGDSGPENPQKPKRLIEELPSVATTLNQIARKMDLVDWSSEDHREWQAEIKRMKQAIRAVSQKIKVKKLPRGRPPKTPK